MQETKTVIVIVGPTAAGKTDLSLQLASHFNTEIISADSRQCYKELNIGVAKPPKEALNLIKHYFISSHSIRDVVNAQVFEEYALGAVEEIFRLHNIAIMVGGTGMYIKAFCEGLDEIPTIGASVRNAVVNAYKKKGLLWLQNEVQKKDPSFWLTAEQKNPQRLMRALEVSIATGASITSFQKNLKIRRPFEIIQIGVELPRQLLYKNIDARVDQMIGDGLVEEATLLMPYKNLNALRTVGYKEIFNYLEGENLLNAAREKIKRNTQQYAKRQLTWFKKYTSGKWFDLSKSNINSVITHIQEVLSV